MFYITHDDVEDLALGSYVLGTGGGGDSSLAKIMLREAIKEHGPVQVVDASDLDPDGLLLPIAVIGAGVGFEEKLLNGGEAEQALHTLEKYMGRKGVAIFPIEVGGVNTLFPLVVAAKLGLPCVDADSMRRAFPRLELTVLTLAGIPSSPAVLVDAKSNAVLLEPIDNAAAETLARATVVAMGMFAVMSAYPITAQQCVDHGILKSLSYALELGRRVSAIQEGKPDAYQQLLEYADAEIIFSGKVVDIERRVTGGWTKGTVTLEHLTDPDRTMRVDIQNENLIAFEDGEAKVMTPDLITFLDIETATPMTTESLSYGQRLNVIGMPAYSAWRTPAGVELAGPRTFGYDIDYVAFGGTK
ncbi:DUF917 domain-containing protein [Arthrobacter bambusae]|uniref:DUF917 domain-containing protein n=1 Tax=Arthrobacter bambusae TaxID=1338426 RepID=UPI0027840439|nr:DUF917 domain-containing protein [Arthrobacter bambusae]MDQ0212989.1 DUF917 family protein [Arthrobacter bambusae]MDQ0237295.1 DUF917 family protein [Arthrobacter bambusae]